MESHPTPFTTTVRATALVGGAHKHGVNLSYFDQDGRTVASAFATLDDVETHAHDLLALVSTARNLEGKVAFGQSPRIRSTLMRDLVVGERQQATATLHDAPPEVPGNLSRFQRLLAAIPQVQA